MNCKRTSSKPFHFILLFFLFSCTQEPQKKEVTLYHHYCSSCHLLPKIEELPKHIWEHSVLPDMLSRMKIAEMYEDPVQMKADFRPEIKLADWLALKKYISSLAPEELRQTPLPQQKILSNFITKKLRLDKEGGGGYTFFDYKEVENVLIVGKLDGSLKRHNFQTGTTAQIYQGETPITWYNRNNQFEIITEVGILDPSELVHGKVVLKEGNDTVALSNSFHRPVHNLVEDLNGDGVEEMVVSEFGNEKGKLSLLVKKSFQYEKKILLNQSGCVKTLAEDMNNDGKLDLITMTSQAKESVIIFYQTDDLAFRADKVLEFSPVYGSSWFELVDYNQDGFLDIITVNGDNADKSYVHKPYHGMRIHLNDGMNNYTETFFYPLNGATRLISHDFDGDGDIDFGLISTFPDYSKSPQLSFVYLENEDAEKYHFKTNVLENPNIGRWFLMDKGDIDKDGDMDILLSSFTYTFTPVPSNLSKQWSESNTDVLILENLLN